MMMVVVAGVGFASCGGDDDDEAGGSSLGLSEAQIREYLESGSGTWSILDVDSGNSKTWYFRNGKTNGWGGSDFSYWGTPYTVSGNQVYITKEDAKNYHGDVLEGGIVITKLTNTTIEFYWKNDNTEKYIGTKQ